jgi:hypothetical protein
MSVDQTLHEALKEDEARLSAADGVRIEAQALYEVAVLRYAALRDAIVSRHSGGVVTGPFRFIRMTMGDAIGAVLSEHGHSLNLQAIYEALKHGGFDVSDRRAVNAALINLRSIEKLQDGSYTYEVEAAQTAP